MTRLGRTRLLTALITVCVAMVLPAVAFAHLERPSYWPDPAPDTSVSPPAGGKVPKLRSLESAVSGRGAGQGARASARARGGWKSLSAAARSRSTRRAQARLPAAARASPSSR